MTSAVSHPGVASPAARWAIAAAVGWQALLVALIFLRPDLDPSWHTISEWAIGRHGWLMVLAFLLSATSYALLFVALRSQVPGWWGRLGLGMLALCAIGTVGVGVFVTDPMPLTPDRPLTIRGTLHVVTGTSAAMLLPAAALLLNLGLALRNPAWRPARRVLLWTAALPLLAFLGSAVHLALFVMPLGVGAYGPGVPIGWPPRLVFLTYTAWLITVAWQATRRVGRAE